MTRQKAILDALHEETDALRDELDTEKNARVAAEKERDAANSGKQTAEQALTDYKTQQTAKESRAAKESKFREQLKAAGVLEKYFDRIVRLSGEDIDKMELDSKGNVKNADKLAESLKNRLERLCGQHLHQGRTGGQPARKHRLQNDQRTDFCNQGRRRASGRDCSKCRPVYRRREGISYGSKRKSDYHHRDHRQPSGD